MAPFYVTLLANILRPSSSGQATPTLSQCPEFPCGDPCYFRENWYIQAAPYDPTKIPTSQREESFEGQNLGFANDARVVRHWCVVRPLLHCPEELDSFDSPRKRVFCQYLQNCSNGILL